MGLAGVLGCGEAYWGSHSWRASYNRRTYAVNATAVAYNLRELEPDQAAVDTDHTPRTAESRASKKPAS